MTILEILTDNATKNPEKVAIYDDKFTFTYRQVDVISNAIANQLSKHVQENSVVSLDLKHTYIIILAILGTLKAGCTYVPLGKNNSDDRNKYIQEVTNSTFTITDNQVYSGTGETLVISDILIGMMASRNEELEQIRNFPLYPYILFTSGSTGEPKGVRVSKDNLNYILNNMQLLCPSSENSVFCLTTPYTFDVSATEIFGWILDNSAVFTFDLNDFKEYKTLLKKIGQLHISHFGASPSLLSMLLDIGDETDILNISNNIKYLIIAGEEMPVRLVERWQQYNIKSKLYNFYGPTETTIYATYYEVPRYFDGESVPIGKPLSGVSVRIENADETGKGELMVIGEGVTAGYLNNDDLTHEKFGKLSDGGSYYRTGDVVSMGDDGNLIFHGRRDDQVELNGIRVELGEIDYLIQRHSNVRESKTLQHHGVLVTFFVNETEIVDVNHLINKLKKCIPPYMVPNVFRQVKQFPLNSSNKIDKKALIQQLNTGEKIDVDKKNYSPSNQDTLNSRVLKIFQETLGTDIGYEDDFFEYGGDSLNVVSCVLQIEEEFNLSVEMDVFYLYRTPRKIVEYLREKFNGSTHQLEHFSMKSLNYLKVNSIKLTGNKDITTASYTQRLYFFKNKKNILTFSIEIPQTFSINQINVAVATVMRKNSILRTSFETNKNSLSLITHSSVSVEAQTTFLPEQRDVINKTIVNGIFQARYEQGSLFDFTIIKNSNNLEIIFGVDHSIFDASSISIFKKEFSSALANKSFEKVGLNYVDFYHKLEAENSLVSVFEHPYIDKLKESNEVCKDIITLIPKGTSHVVVQNVVEFSGDMLSYLISYLSSSKLAEMYALDHVTTNLILNIRKFSSFSISDTIGDVHSTVQLVYEGESYEEYLRKSSSVVQEVFKKELFSPRTVAYINYPDMSEQQLEIRQIIGNDIPISISFVGAVSEEELEKYQQNVAIMQSEMDKTADLSRIYATAVLCKNELHIFYNHKVYEEHVLIDFLKIK